MDTHSDRPTRRELRQLFSREFMQRKIEIDRAAVGNPSSPFERAISNRIASQSTP